MRARFLRAVLFSAAVIGIVLVPALPAHAQCTHLGQQVVCPSGVSNGSTSLSFTNGSILWQAPTGSTTLSPSAGCCSPFTAPTPTPTAPSATGLTPTTAAGQNALSNAVRTPSGAVVSDRAPLEAERQYRFEAYRLQEERAIAAESEASAAEREVQKRETDLHDTLQYYRYSIFIPTETETNENIWALAYFESRAREAGDRGDNEEYLSFKRAADYRRENLQEGEQSLVRRAVNVEIVQQELLRAKEQARAARERANAARRGAEETYRRYSEARREAEAGAERQPTEQAQPVQPVQQAQQFTVYFSDPATGSEYLRGYLEAARPVINQSDAANARPPAPRLP